MQEENFVFLFSSYIFLCHCLLPFFFCNCIFMSIPLEKHSHALPNWGPGIVKDWTLIWRVLSIILFHMCVWGDFTAQRLKPSPLPALKPQQR